MAQLRVVALNAANSSSSTAGPRAGMDLILSAIGSNVSDDPTTPGNPGIIRPIDVLCLQEAHASATTGVAYAGLLNALYGTTRYAAGTLDGASTGSGTQVIVYNTETLSLLGQATVGTTSTSGQPRQVTRYRVRPTGGYGASADVYLYNSHAKAGNTSTDRTRRQVEFDAIRADAAALPTGSNAIVLGDLNVYTSSEAGYAALVAPGAGQVLDPINQPGAWSGNLSFRSIHTQSPFDPEKSAVTGFNGTSGGVDDRFDQQLTSPGMLDRNGVAYIPGSYAAFGNNGSHQMDQPINTGSGASPAVLDALAGILDHLPIVADYQLPAKMAVTVDPVPARVITGTPVSAGVRVRNVAPVSVANGADELAYTVSGGGAVSAAGSGTLLALAPAAVINATVNTTTPGVRSGTVSVNSTSEAVADGAFATTVTTTVLSPARPSLSGGTETTSTTIDLGIWGIGQAPAAQGFAIHNLVGVAGFTAGLDVDGTSVADPRLSLALPAITALPAGTSAAGTLALATTSAGALDALVSLATSDENVTGAAPRATLTLRATGFVTLAGDATLDLAVGIGDFALLAAGFNGPGTWQGGDFTHDGSVGIGDFALLASNFNLTAATLPRAGSSVPEPTGAAVGLALAGAGLVRRRRAR